MELLPQARIPRLAVEIEAAGRTWQVRAKSSSVSVSVDASTIFTFDREGRPWSAHIDATHYRRGLDGGVRARPADARDDRRWLAAEEADDLWCRVRAELRELEAHGHGVPGRALADGPAADLAKLLGRLLSWDAARLANDVDHFRRVYTSVPVLPPDRYNALVVQVTRGCPWNRCTFCDLYRDRSYAALTTDQLDAHLGQVRAFFGDGLTARRHLFLGDANLLSLPRRSLLPHLARVRSAFPESTFRDMSAFADVLGPSRYTDDDLASMRRVGLRRLYFGLESGSGAVRGLLGKPGDASDAVSAVRRLRECGISSGIIVLLGAGGDGLEEDHISCTVRALRQMRLGTEDIVFYSPLRTGREYLARARAAGLRRLDEAALQAQRGRLDAALPPRSADGPRRAAYDLEDFVY